MGRTKGSVQLNLCHIWLCVTPWTAGHPTFLYINLGSLLKLMSIELVMPSNHLILCHPPFLLQSFPASESFSMSQFSPWVSKVLELQHQCLKWIFRTDFLLDWLVWYPFCTRDFQVFSSTTVQKHQLFSIQFSLWSNSQICAWPLEKPYRWLYWLWSVKQYLCYLICCLDLS